MAETLALGQRLAARLKKGDLVALDGDLGAGKTVLVRGIVRGLGADESLLSSPTYVLVQHYPGRIPVYHVDLYRVPSGPGELAGLGLEEMLADGVVVMEWAGRAGEALPRPCWRVSITATSRRSRLFTVEPAK